ncbi:ATP-grasp domain-containing protein [Streptomyces sp. TP-A0874]|uniref:ATP-grasp domain-containing protein n=1 Tax=Streptomyces sp. TP-A0874 TaxID=549819 RepID=UPI0008529D33|nr:ATP-grasp domain-containing protein [Streptomyces sp. TP-A0874]
MHILMVETTRPRGFDYLEELAAAGMEVSFLTEDLGGYAGTQGFERHKLAARVVELPELRRGEGLVPLLRDRLGPHPVDGVLCVLDDFLIAAACLARDLGVPHERVETVRLLRDKAAVRERLTEAGVGTLRWRRADTPEQALAAAADIGYPVVVKPVAGHGSVGVSVLWNDAQAERVLACPRETGRLLIEEYRAGREVAAQVLVQGGRPHLYGFGERLPSPPTSTVEPGGHFPARFEQRGAVRRFVSDVVRALGIRDSALHIELLVTATGPELIEVNGRMAGYVIPRQMGIALGRSIPLDLAALCTGEPVPPLGEPVSYVALRNLCSDRGGTVRAVDVPGGLPEGVTDHWISVKPGDRVAPTSCNADRLGYVLAEGDTAAEAGHAADRAFGRIRDGLSLDEEHGAPTARDEAAGGERAEHGPHVVLLLDADPDGPRPERILDAIGGSTGHVSVFWCGPGEPAPDLRERWSRRSAGTWYDTPGRDAAEAALRSARAERPVAAVVTFTAGLQALRDRLGSASPEDARQPLDGAEAARRAVAEPPPRGHVVLSSVHGGRVRHLDVLEDLGTDAEGHRTLCRPTSLAEPGIEALHRAAEEAVTASGIGAGVVRCHFGGDPVGASGAPVPDAVLPGLDEATHALYDTAHTRDLVTTAVDAALGRPERRPAPRAGAAVFRSLAAPAGAFRVVAASPAAELFDHPEVGYVRAALTAGQVRTENDRDARMCYTVAGQDLSGCLAVTSRVEAALVFRHLPLDRTHVAIIDRIGAATWTREDGTPLLPPDRFRVSVLSGSPSVKESKARLDLALHTDVFDHDATAGIVAELHRTHPVHRIAAASERLLAPAAALRKELGLPGDSPRFTRGLLDKAEMKRLARRGGIAHAEGRVLYEPADAYELFEEYGAVVIKPRSLSGSQGVAICEDRPSLDRWLERRFVPGRFLVERKVSGPMCHIDAVVHEGVVAWDVSLYQQDSLAFTRGQPFSSKTVDDPLLRRRAEALLEQTVAAWGIRSAVLHMEAFVEGERLVFCEVAGRPGGAGIISAFQVTRGIDLRHAKILIDAGEDPGTLRQEPVARHAGWTVHYSSGGVLAEYDDSAVAPYAYHRTVSTEIGGRTTASAFSGTGLSTHVFADDSSDEIGRLIAAAEREIRITLLPATPPSVTG